VVEILKIVGKLSWIHTFSATLQNGNVKTRVLQNKLVNVSPRSAVFFCFFVWRRLLQSKGARTPAASAPIGPCARL
jgi:hypothetical protein